MEPHGPLPHRRPATKKTPPDSNNPEHQTVAWLPAMGNTSAWGIEYRGERIDAPRKAISAFVLVLASGGTSILAPHPRHRIS